MNKDNINYLCLIGQIVNYANNEFTKVRLITDCIQVRGYTYDLVIWLRKPTEDEKSCILPAISTSKYAQIIHAYDGGYTRVVSEKRL